MPRHRLFPFRRVLTVTLRVRPYDQTVSRDSPVPVAMLRWLFPACQRRVTSCISTLCTLYAIAAPPAKVRQWAPIWRPEWPNVPDYSHSFIPPHVMPPSGNIICEATIPSSVTLFMSQFGVLRPRYPVAYNMVMVEIRQTEAYARWFRRLRDRQARVRIDSRIRRLSLGNIGDVRPVGEGVSEIRIDYGPGYRVYFVQRGEALVVLLARGDKDSQDRDIRRALDLARGL